MTNTPKASGSSNEGTKTAPGTPSPHISPMHHPTQKAQVLPQQKPLGQSRVISNSYPISQETAAGLGQKALLAKKFAKANKPTISPTDQMQSPTTQKLSEAKQRHYGKGKPASLAQSFTAIRDSSGPSTNPTSKPDF